MVSDLDKEKTISIGSQERRKVNNQGLCFVLTRAVASCRPRVHATGIFFPIHALFFVCFFQSIFLGCVCVIFFYYYFYKINKAGIRTEFFFIITWSMNQTCSRNRSVFVLRSILSSAEWHSTNLGPISLSKQMPYIKNIYFARNDCTLA